MGTTMPFDLSTANPVLSTGNFDLATARPVTDPYGAFSSPTDPYASFSSPAGTTPSEASWTDRLKVIPPAVQSWLTGTLGLPVDTVRNVQQIGKALVALPYLAAGRGADAPSWVTAKDDRSNIFGSSAYLAKKSAEAGVPTDNPNPNDLASRVIYTAAQAAPNAFLGGAQTTGNLAQSAGMNVAGAEAASGAQSAFPSQPAAPFLASLLTQGAPTMATAGAKRLLRGPEGGDGQQRVQQTVQNFSDAGAGTPTVGQATGRQLPQAIENLVSKIPGGFGVMRDKANAIAQGISDEISRMTGNLSSSGTAEQAGRAIQRGITGEGGFVDQFRKTQGELYDKLDQHLAADAGVPVTATKAALARINAPVAGAPATSSLLQNPKLQGIETALAADTSLPNGTLEQLQAGTLPYQALKQLRTMVGNQISDWSITNDVPKSKWSALYAGLTEDLRGAAQTAGPEAMQAWNRANNYTRAGMARVETVQSVLDRNGGPEAVFNAAMSGSKTGATTLRAVLQSLPPDSAKSIVATVLNRMGRANPSNQNDVGDVFSTERFLTNLNSLSPQAKIALFSRFGNDADVSAISKVADNLRSGSKVLANPSGTGAYVAAGGMLGATGTSLATGRPGAAALALAPIPASYGAAKFMTSPRVVNALARDTPISDSRRFNALLQQAQLANRLSDGR